MRQSGGAGCCHDNNLHLPTTELWRGKCRPTLNKSTCWACWNRPNGDSRLFFWFSATQLARVCLASYRRHLSWSVCNEWAFCMKVTCGNGNVHSRTSHTMMMMIIIIITPSIRQWGFTINCGFITNRVTSWFHVQLLHATLVRFLQDAKIEYNIFT